MAKKPKTTKKKETTLEVDSLFIKKDTKQSKVSKVKTVVPKRIKPFNMIEANEVLYSMDTKGIRNCAIIAANPIANCKEDYSAWLNKNT